MKEMEQIYEVKAPLWIALPSTAVYLGTFIVMALDHEFSVSNLWKSGDWIALVAFLVFVFVFPFIFLIVLFTKTVFTRTGIIHRNFILMETQKRYEDISAVEVTKRADIRLHFVDGTSIKVLTGESCFLKTLQVLEDHVRPDLMPVRR